MLNIYLSFIIICGIFASCVWMLLHVQKKIFQVWKGFMAEFSRGKWHVEENKAKPRTPEKNVEP